MQKNVQVVQTLISGVVISLITRPLNKLAHYSENSLKKEKEYVDGNYLHIESPIYEVRQLYVQVLEYLKVLNKEVRIDGLTQLNNRKTFDLALESYVKEGFLFSMIMIDIDYFKEINDTSGHIVGDQVLKYLSRQLEATVRKKDTCYRYGGEEFMVLLRNADEDKAYDIAEEIRMKIAHTNSPTGKPITISLGVTSSEQSDKHGEELIQRADVALYQSKKTGRNKTTIFHYKDLDSLL